jgi:hypothetical protein
MKQGMSGTMKGRADSVSPRQSFAARAAIAASFAAIMSVFASPALATYGNVHFTGAIPTAGSCTIVVTQNGGLKVSSDVKQMSSKFVGGTPGMADVNSNGVYQLSVTTPPTFTVGPVNADLNVTRQVLFSGYDLNSSASFAERSTPIYANGNIRTRMTINFAAQKTTGTFTTGHYQALTWVRCE